MKQGWPNTPGWTVIGGRGYNNPVPDLPENIWSVEWRRLGDRIRVDDPIYGKQVTLEVHEIDSPDGPVKFAAGEVSNGVFLFAVPLYR